MTILILMISIITLILTSTTIENVFGSAISGLIALLIFILGLFFEKKKKKIKEKARLKKFQSYITFQIDNLYETGMKQIEELKRFSILLKQKKEQDLHLTIISGYIPNEIVKFINENLFDLLVDKRNGNMEINNKNYSELTRNLRLLSNIDNITSNLFNDLKKETQNKVFKYKKHIEKIVRRMEEIGTQAEKNSTKIGEDNFIDKYAIILNNFTKDKNNTDIYKSYPIYIKKLHSLCSNKKIVVGDTRINSVLPDIMQAIYSYKEFMQLIEFTINQYSKTANNINTALNKIILSYKNIITNDININQ